MRHLHTPLLLSKREASCSSTLVLKVSQSSCVSSVPSFELPVFAVYPGMVIGESSKAPDIYVNPCAKKQLTNIRAAGADEKIVIASPRIMNMEVRASVQEAIIPAHTTITAKQENIAYMADDELVEITPKSVRLRKAELDMGVRMRTMKGKRK